MKEKKYLVILTGCPTESNLKAVYYPKTDSVLIAGELIPMQYLNQYGQRVIYKT